MQTSYPISHRLLHAGIFFLPVLALTVFKGISYPASLIWLSSLAVLWPWRGLTLNRDSLMIAFAFYAYPAAIIISMAFSGKWIANDFDKPSRFLLILPVLFAVRKAGLPQGGLFLGLALGAIGSGLLAVYDVLTGMTTRVDGFTNAIIFGDISALMGIMALTPLLQAYFKKQPISHHNQLQTLLIWLAIPALLLGLLGGYFSGTRAVIFSAPILLGALFFFYLNNHTQRLLSLAAILAVLAGSYLTIPGVTRMVDTSFFSSRDYLTKDDIGQEKERSVGLRMELWKGAWLLGSEHPLAGVGPDNFRSRKNQLIEEGKLSPIIQPFGHAHNDFLTFWAEAGILGLLSLPLLYGFVAWRSWQHRVSQPALAINGVLLGVSFTLFGLTQAMLTHNLSTTFFIFMAAIIIGALPQTTKN